MMAPSGICQTVSIVVLDPGFAGSRSLMTLLVTSKSFFSGGLGVSAMWHHLAACGGQVKPLGERRVPRLRWGAFRGVASIGPLQLPSRSNTCYVGSIDL